MDPNDAHDMEKKNERLDREEANQVNQEIKFASGASSSYCPPYYLIPKNALERLANVFQRGINRKGDAAWNVYGSQEALTDINFVIDRVSHIIKHALQYRDKLIGKIDWNDPNYPEDDAAAIMWGGAFLAEVNKKLITLEIAPLMKQNIPSNLGQGLNSSDKSFDIKKAKAEFYKMAEDFQRETRKVLKTD